MKSRSNGTWSRGFPVLILCLTLVFVFAPFSQPSNAQGDNPESAVCLDCHEGNLAGSPHQIDERTACTGCHAGDRRHYEEDPETYPMSNPAKLSPMAAGKVCASCHLTNHQQNMLEGNAHTNNNVNCSGCHKVHGNTMAGLLKGEEYDMCLDCHKGVRGAFALPYRHPVNDGIVKCSECHMTLDRSTQPVSFAGSSAACFECHNEFQGPFPFEHQATVDYSTEEGACMTCHEPHGTYLPRMLKQPYEPPHYQLCSQCHVVPKHNFNMQHGTQWAGVPCNDCHVDIHGSYESRYYFDASLQAQGCIQVGCHQF